MSEERRFGGRDHWQLWIAAVAFCLAVVWFFWQVLWPAATTLTHGFGAYYSASRLLSNGKITADIYDPDYFRPIVKQDSGGAVEDIFNANPPTTTLMLWPFSFLPIEQARLFWTIANVAFLVAGLGLLLWGLDVSLSERKNWPIWLIVLVFSLLFRPVVQNFMLGQAYILVFLLLSITTIAFFVSQSTNQQNKLNQPINQLTGGFALSLSLLLKTAGWPLLILFLWLRKFKLSAWVIGSSIVVLVATLPIFSLEMWLAYVRLLLRVGRSPLVCVPAYQTTRSWLCHLFAPGVVWQEAESAGIGIPIAVTVIYFILSVVTILGLLRLARKRPGAAFMGFVCWGVLFLPLGEVHHHTVMLIPLVWFVVNWRGRSRVSRVMVVVAAVCYLISFPVNAPQFQAGWQALLAYPYLAGAWLIFVGILWDHKLEMIPGRG